MKVYAMTRCRAQTWGHRWHHERMPATVALTLAEAASVLDPPLTERQLRQIVAALGWQPSGRRSNGRRGHPVWTYDSAALLALHAAVSPFIGGVLWVTH